MTSSFHPIRARKRTDGLLFGICTLALLLGSASLAALAPIAFSIATVFLFAAPHNWIELRYCLSRLPSRVGPLGPFFATSFGGLAILYLSYIALVTGARLGFIDRDIGLPLVATWNILLIGWCVLLAAVRFRNTATILKATAFGLLACTFSLLMPRWFSLCLVYLHPFIGMAILERELRRTKRSWLQSYHWCLALVPVLLIALAVHLNGTAQLYIDTRLDEQITRHAGSAILPDVSSHLLVAVHTFLEMLHYGVWCLAIPVATNAVRNWKVDRFASTRNSGASKKLIGVVLGISSLIVLAFWAAFTRDYSFTRDFYFAAAMIHVLAEIPLLMWMCEVKNPAKRNAAVLACRSDLPGSAGAVATARRSGFNDDSGLTTIPKTLEANV